MDFDLLKAHLSVDGDLAFDLHTFDRIDSTNTWLMNNGEAPAVCIARHQTAGRGRQLKQWQSAQGHIALSIKWMFEHPPAHIGWLSLNVGMTLVQTLLAKTDLTTEQLKLKWPNDLYINDQKLAGLLLQSKRNGQEWIIGIGLNYQAGIALKNIDQAWTALGEHLIDPPKIEVLCATIIQDQINALANFPEDTTQTLAKQWQQYDYLYGQPVTVHLAQGTEKSGFAMGIDELGRFCLGDGTNITSCYYNGDVSIRIKGLA